MYTQPYGLGAPNPRCAMHTDSVSDRDSSLRSVRVGLLSVRRCLPERVRRTLEARHRLLLEERQHSRGTKVDFPARPSLERRSFDERDSAVPLGRLLPLPITRQATSDPGGADPALSRGASTALARPTAAQGLVPWDSGAMCHKYGPAGSTPVGTLDDFYHLVEPHFKILAPTATALGPTQTNPLPVDHVLTMALGFRRLEKVVWEESRKEPQHTFGIGIDPTSSNYYSPNVTKG